MEGGKHTHTHTHTRARAQSARNAVRPCSLTGLDGLKLVSEVCLCDGDAASVDYSSGWVLSSDVVLVEVSAEGQGIKG